MAQYATYNEGDTRIFTDEYSSFRIRIADGNFYFDRAITDDAFDGVENTDWEAVETKKAVGGLGVFRIGVRDAAFVWDETLTATGFAGTENVDWVNIDSAKAE